LPLSHSPHQDTGFSTAQEEFATGDADVRVLARKHRDRPEWLVTAWAAGGEARDVQVEIPDLGALTLHARPAGSVYVVKKSTNGKPQQRLMDRNPLQPTQP
jgi:hypothetical protein